jgi:hypothetical protein
MSLLCFEPQNHAMSTKRTILSPFTKEYHVFFSNSGHIFERVLSIESSAFIVKFLMHTHIMKWKIYLFFLGKNRKFIFYLFIFKFKFGKFQISIVLNFLVYLLTLNKINPKLFYFCVFCKICNLMFFY